MVLMIVSIVGANLFQGYWLYQAYRLNHREMNRHANIALAAAVSRTELSRAQDVLGSFDSVGQVVFHTAEKPLAEIHGKKRIVLLSDSLPAALHNDSDKTIHITLHEAQAQDSMRQYADTLARRISSMLVMNKMYEKGVDLKEIETAYKEELKSRNVEAEFSLDTLRVVSWKDHRYETPPAIKIGQPIETRIIAVNPLSRLGVQAHFPHPAPHILSRMIGTLIGSVVLLVVTTWAFIYMLRTILKQKKLSEIKSDFINNMTHELKTPIATVSAAVEALQHFNAMNDPAKSKDYLEISRSELNRLSGLVEKVLNIAVEERRELDLHPEPVQVVQLLEEVVQRYRIRNGKPVEISLEHNLANVTAMLDRTHFTNAIHNLVDNAIKYSYDSVRIAIRCTGEEGWLRISVSDNGIGIPKAYQHSIFEQFFRVPQGDLHNVKGFGLGLAYVKKIVEKHGGRISVKSEPKHGSEFTIAIPQA